MILLSLLACLPKEAVSRRQEVEADRYRLEVTVETTTTGPVAIEPFTWHLAGDLLSSWTRNFRDGSMGRLERFEGLAATVTRAERTTPAPTGLDGAFVELRAFPTGQVLKVDPLAPWAGGDAHIELLDLVWPTLSPAIPPVGEGRSAPMVSSWPTALTGRAPLRSRIEATWTLEERGGGVGTWSYRGTYAAGEIAVGEIEGRVTIDTRVPRVLDHAVTCRRVVRTPWPAGELAQTQRTRLALHFEGTARRPTR